MLKIPEESFIFISFLSKRRIQGNIPLPNGDIHSPNQDHGLQRGEFQLLTWPPQLAEIFGVAFKRFYFYLFPHALCRLDNIRELQIKIQHSWKCLKGVFKIYRINTSNNGSYVIEQISLRCIKMNKSKLRKLLKSKNNDILWFFCR